MFEIEPTPECEHKWERQSEWSRPIGKYLDYNAIQRYKCEKCKVWGYSRNPRQEPFPYEGGITEPKPSWKEDFINELSMQRIDENYTPPDDFEFQDKPIGWSPPDKWVEPKD